MSLRGVQINEGAIGANVAGDNREFGLVCNGVAVVDKAQLNTSIKLRRPSDAEALGITPQYDAANNVRVHRHIAEFYRRAGEGRVLHVMLVGQSVLPVAMVEYAKQLTVASGGTISDMAFAFNPYAGYAETIVDGLNADINATIPALQTFAEWSDANDMPLHTILEGRGITDTVLSLADLRDFKIEGNVLQAQKVTLCIGQDWRYAETQDEIGKKFADVGTLLGVVASHAWNRNPGEVATQNLSDVARGIWLVGGLSNHKKYDEVYDALETLNDKGYVFPIRYQGTAGWYWNDGHCCTPIIIDADGNINQHTIYYSHTMDMSKRMLRQVYLPEVKKPVELEEGILPQDMVDYYNALGDNGFGLLSGRGLISGGRTQIVNLSVEETQEAKANNRPYTELLIDKILGVQFAVTPTGMINEIIGVINLRRN
ncbi:MAG: DUF2586 family protein [Bacteroidetes bacterium]|nr:DUF2586 family protein [Bacteroidota bacterium]